MSNKSLLPGSRLSPHRRPCARAAAASFLSLTCRVTDARLCLTLRRLVYNSVPAANSWRSDIRVPRSGRRRLVGAAALGGRGDQPDPPYAVPLHRSPSRDAPTRSPSTETTPNTTAGPERGDPRCGVGRPLPLGRSEGGWTAKDDNDFDEAPELRISPRRASSVYPRLKDGCRGQSGATT